MLLQIAHYPKLGHMQDLGMALYTNHMLLQHPKIKLLEIEWPKSTKNASICQSSNMGLFDNNLKHLKSPFL